jgi:hypothetical protein
VLCDIVEDRHQPAVAHMRLGRPRNANRKRRRLVQRLSEKRRYDIQKKPPRLKGKYSSTDEVQ